MCRLLCALDGVERNAVDDEGETALHKAMEYSLVDSVRALLEFNVDASKARVTARTKVAIAQLLEEHRNRSVNKHFFRLELLFLILFFLFRKLNELQFAIECSRNE